MLLRTGTLTEESLCDGLTAFAEYRLNLTPTIVMFMFWIRRIENALPCTCSSVGSCHVVRASICLILDSRQVCVLANTHLSMESHHHHRFTCSYCQLQCSSVSCVFTQVVCPTLLIMTRFISSIKSFSCSFVSNIWANPHPPTGWLSITFGFFVECGMFDALSNLPQDRIMISWLGYFVKPQVNFPLERCAPLVHALINVTSFCHGICLAFPRQMCVAMESVQC